MSWFAAWVLVENELPLQPSEQTDNPNSATVAALSEELPHAVKMARRQDVARILLREGSIFTMTKSGRPRGPRDGSRGLLSAKFNKLNTMHTQTYIEQRKGTLTPPPPLHKTCQLLAFTLLGLLSLGATSCSSENAGSPFVSEASRSLAASFSSSEEAIDALRVRARTAAERLHTNATVEEITGLQAELELTMHALAALDGADAFPWSNWIQESRFVLPELTEQELLVATQVLDDQAALALCRTCDFREMPAKPRLVAHHAFWRIDMHEGFARGRKLLFLENTRARDLMRQMYVEQVLPQVEGEEAQPWVMELYLDIATEESMEPRARSLAVRALREHRSREAPAILESLFDTESTNFLIRKEAMLAILDLDPERGHRMLLDKMPARDIDPGTWEFMRELRVREGLPVPPQ